MLLKVQVMDDTTYSRTEFQRQAADWLLSAEHNAMVTLTFSGDEGGQLQAGGKGIWKLCAQVRMPPVWCKVQKANIHVSGS